MPTTQKKTIKKSRLHFERTEIKMPWALHTYTFLHLCCIQPQEHHFPVINNWFKKTLRAVVTSSNREFVFACWQLPAGTHAGKHGGSGFLSSCFSASKSEVDHLHTQGTVPLPLGWRSLQLHVWEPGVWRWPAAVYSPHFAVRCPSRWVPRSHFLRSWLEVGSL